MDTGAFYNYDEEVSLKDDWYTDDVATAINVAVFIIFTLIIFFYAMFATYKMKRMRDLTYEEFLIGARTIGLSVTSLSLAGSYSGATTASGTVEVIYSSGLVWALSIFGFPVSLLIGGLVFARRFRKARHMTMLEPFKEQYGDIVPAILFLLVAISEIFLAASLLATIGYAMRVVMGLDSMLVVFVFGIFTASYTFYGGLYAVAYSGILQLVLSQVLWVPAIVAYNNEAVGTNSSIEGPPIAPFPETTDIGVWIDTLLLVVLGGTVSQVFFQRILSCKSAGNSQVASVLASVACLIIAMPAAFMGYIAVKTDWSKTSLGRHIPPEEHKLLLAHVLSQLCPRAVAIMGILSASAASMAAIDAGFLAVASLFVHHVYLPLRSCLCKNHQPSDLESVWVTRGAVLFFGCIASVIAVTMSTIFGIMYLASDLCYIILFPQLICVLFVPFSNVWGSLSGLFFGLLFRILSGEALMNLPALIKWPFYDAESAYQRFPFRTFIMIFSLIIILLVSFVSGKFIVRRAQPEMADEHKKTAWFGSEGDYKQKSEESSSDAKLSEKGDTQL